jgi:hypothetical protein
LVLLPGLTVWVFVGTAVQVGEGATSPPWFQYITTWRSHKKSRVVDNQINEEPASCPLNSNTNVFSIVDSFSIMDKMFK